MRGIGNREQGIEGKGLMGVRLVLSWTIGLLVMGSNAWAHGGRLAGHHWEDADYVNEIRLQIGLMAIVMCLMLAGYLLHRIWQKRSLQ